MNSAEIESIVSQRDSKTDTMKTPIADEVKEEFEVNAMDVSIKDVGKEMKDQSTDVAIQESAEVPLNEMKDILD
jgi:hypothetical protein